MRRYARKRLPQDECPAEFTLTLIQGKWTLRLIFLLLQRPCHFGELKRLLPGISSEVLATRLASLSANGLIENRAEEAPYALTTKGESLLPALTALAEWGLGELRGRGIHWNPPTVAPKPGTRRRRPLAPVVKKFLLR